MYSKFLISLLIILNCAHLFGQEENEYVDSESDIEFPEEIMLGDNGEFKLKKVLKRAETFHYKLIDSKNIEYLPAIINDVDELDNTHFLFHLDNQMILMNEKMEILKEFSFNLNPIPKTNFYFDEFQLYTFNSNNNFIPLYEILKVSKQETKNYSINQTYLSYNNDVFPVFLTKSYQNSEDGVLSEEMKMRLFSAKKNQFISQIYNNITHYNNYFFCYLNAYSKEVDVINLEGEIVHKFNKLELFQNGCIAQDKNLKYGFFDKNWKQILPCEYENIKINLIKSRYKNSGYEIGNEFYDEPKYFNDSIFYILASKKNFVSLFDSKGVKILKDSYQDIIPLLNNHFLVKKNNKYGVLNIDNTSILSVIYDSILPWQNRMYFRNNSKWNIIEIDSKSISNLEIDDIEIINWGLIVLTKNNKKTVVSTNSKLENNRFSFDDFKIGVHKQLIVSQDNKWGVYSLRYGEDRLIIPCEYDEIAEYKTVYTLKKNNLYKLFSNNIGMNEKEYDKIYFTLIYDDFNSPYEFYCIKNNMTEIVNFDSENLWGM